jgi:hypothetical protein
LPEKQAAKSTLCHGFGPQWPEVCTNEENRVFHCYSHTEKTPMSQTLHKDPAALEALVADLEADYRPSTETEALLVHDLAKFHWLADRAIRLQGVAFAASALPEMPASVNVLIRYQTSSPPVQQPTPGRRHRTSTSSFRSKPKQVPMSSLQARRKATSTAAHYKHSTTPKWTPWRRRKENRPTTAISKN